MDRAFNKNIDTEKCKVGEIVEASKKNAENYVNEGYAEYIEEPKKIKKQKVTFVPGIGKVEIKEPKEEFTKKQEAELQMWIGNIERKIQLFHGEPNDLPTIPKHLLPRLADRFDFVKTYLEESQKFNKYEEDEEGNKKLTKESVKNRIEALINFDEIDREEELEIIAKLSKIKITILRRQLEKILKVKKTEEKKDEPKVSSSNAFQIFTISGQVQQFYEQQPFFFNKNGMFVVWDEELKKYDMCDEVDMLNGMSKIGADTISSKTKTEIINALKQFGRKRIPIDAPVTWVQFKGKIHNYKTGEMFDASPEYFITNPIPFDLGKCEETPTIDNLLIEWVGEEYKTTLEEIIAYSVSSDQFMQRLIALVGGGSNGKGTFLKLLVKFLGEDNTTSSELKELSSNQFETAVIYKKLLCIMGEVSYDDLKNTNQLKKLAGEDPIRYCFKGKTPFTEKSSTTLVSATNSLPMTPDKTMGFYRKWLIVDFPNQFTEIKHGIIESIPEVEFENLAKKVFRILNEMYKSQKFTNEGSFEERMSRYEERSNPIARFIESECEEIMGESTELRVFSNKFNEYAKNNHLRILSVRQIGKTLRDEGFEMGKRAFNIEGGNKTSKQVILNLFLKNTENTKNTETSSHFPRRESSENYSISGIPGIPNNINQKTLPITNKKQLQLTDEEIESSGFTKEELEGLI